MNNIYPSFDNAMEPVFIKNSEIIQEKWLEVKQVEEFDKRNMGEALKNPVPPLRKVTFKLLDTSLYECLKCGAKIKTDGKEPIYCKSGGHDADFKMITSDIEVPKNIWRIPIWIDLDIDMFEIYDDLIKLLKQTIKFQEEIQYKIFALWIIATYKHPLWETIPYLHFKGLPASGKTRAMEMAKLLAYRSVLVSGITFTAIVRINHNYNVSLCIDEIDSKLDERNEMGREYTDFLKSGYKKGSMYIASDLNDQKKVVYYNNYGPKILTGEKGIYNEALLSRTITFDMEQDFPEISSLSTIEQECNDIRTKLLNYRFKTNMPDILTDEIPLKARYREIFDCLIRTAQHIGQKTDDLIKFAKDMEEAIIIEMQGTIQWDVLNVLYEASCQGTLDAVEGIKLSQILEELDLGDEPKKNAQRLGYIIKNFGLVTKKKRDCTWLSFVDLKNSHKLNYLFKRYKIGGGVDT
jgi:DNA-directed RNA polymerase subunit RPC12/RpoP